MAHKNILEDVMKLATEGDSGFNEFPGTLELVRWHKFWGSVHRSVAEFELSSDDKEYAHNLTACAGAVILDVFSNLIAKEEHDNLIKVIHTIAHGSVKSHRNLIRDNMTEANEYDIKVNLIMPTIIQSVGAEGMERT